MDALRDNLLVTEKKVNPGGALAPPGLAIAPLGFYPRP